MKEFCLIPKVMAERFLRQTPSTGSEYNENNSNNDINNNNNANKTLKSLKRISSIHKTKRPLSAARMEENKNNNKEKNIHRQQQQQRQRRRAQPRPQRVSVAKDANFPPKVKLLMTNRSTSTSTTTDAADLRPNLDNLINISAKTATTKEYIKSFLSLLRNTPELSWDASGNLLGPFRNYNIINILKTLSNAGDKKGFQTEDVPLIRMILHSASMDPSFIRNNKAKKQLMGGSKPSPLLAQSRRMRWERYRL